MKFALAFLGISFAFFANQALLDLTKLDALLDFLVKYNKSYGLVEGLKRRLEFTKILEMILNHNRDYNKGLFSFKLKTNRFADLYSSEKLSLSTGYRVPPYDFAEFSIQGKSIRTVNSTLCPPGPPTFDWRMKNCVTPIKNQGYTCRNCWAFSSVAALESHWCIKTGQLISLSEQQLVDCNRNAQTGSWGWFLFGQLLKLLDSSMNFSQAVTEAVKRPLSCTSTATAEFKMIRLMLTKKAHVTREFIRVATTMKRGSLLLRVTGESVPSTPHLSETLWAVKAQWLLLWVGRSTPSISTQAVCTTTIIVNQDHRTPSLSSVTVEKMEL